MNWSGARWGAEPWTTSTVTGNDALCQDWMHLLRDYAELRDEFSGLWSRYAEPQTESLAHEAASVLVAVGAVLEETQQELVDHLLACPGCRLVN